MPRRFNREMGESCLRDGRGGALAKHLSISPQMPRSAVLMGMHEAAPCALEKNDDGGNVKKQSGGMSPRATGCEATQPVSHARLGLSRQKVSHLETVPSFLGILYGEKILGRQVLGDCAATMLHGRVLPCWETHAHTSRAHVRETHVHPSRAHTVQNPELGSHLCYCLLTAI